MALKRAKRYIIRSEGRAYGRRINSALFSMPILNNENKSEETNKYPRQKAKQELEELYATRLVDISQINGSEPILKREESFNYLSQSIEEDEREIKSINAFSQKLKTGFQSIKEKFVAVFSKNSYAGEHEAILVRRKKPRNFILTVFFSTLSMLVIFVAMMGFGGLGLAAGIAKAYIYTTPGLDLSLIEDQSQTSLIYDSNGELITTFVGTENRELVSIVEIPDMLINAFISIEDVRFYNHNGIDIKRLISAVINTLRNQDTHGGSTITQQLIKNRILTNEVSYKRKIQEAYLAMELEKEYTKDQILEAYLNAIPLGGLNYGVKAAADDYFGKSLSQLTIRECAMLAGLTQNPTRYHPRTNMYVKNDFTPTDTRTDTVLRRMYETGSITKDQYESALKEKVNIVPTNKVKEIYDMPYFVEYAIYDVITHTLRARNLQDNKQNRKNIETELRNGGYRIYTTVDRSMQDSVQNSLSQWSKYPTLRDPSKAVKIVKNQDGTVDEIPQPQSAAVVIDHKTGEIKALVGGRDTPLRRKQLNRAYQSAVPVGSSIKPLAIYGPALDMGYSPGSIILNYAAPIEGWNTEKGYPGGGLSKQGPVTLRNGIRQSLNVVAARILLEKVGAENAKQYLEKLGVDPSRINVDGPGLALGTSGISPLEMSAAYATIANGGNYSEPIAFTKVLDSKGNIILDARASRVSRNVYKRSTAYLLTDMLENAITAGTGSKAKLKNMRSAGKTGTNDDYRSVYFAGFTPYYSSAVWIGHDDYSPQLKSGATGGTYAAPLWKDYMDKIHTGLSDKPIYDDTPAQLGLVQRTICTVSGLLATDACKADSSRKPSTEYFPADNAVREKCDHHLQAEICSASKMVANPYCPEELRKKSVILAIPQGSQLYTIPANLLTETLGEIRLGVSATEIVDMNEGSPDYYKYYCDLHSAFTAAPEPEQPMLDPLPFPEEMQGDTEVGNLKEESNLVEEE